MSSTRPKTRLGRLALYLHEQFPILVHVPVALASFYACYLLLFRRPAITGSSLLGALTVFAALLMLRVSDELKDEDSDRQHFPDRALPRGDVDRADLESLTALCLVTILLANLWLSPLRRFVLLALLPSLLLMRHWFFLPQRISRDLLLALATHNPIVPLLTFYAYLVARQDGAPALGTKAILLLLGAFWLPSLAWEIGRKIRAPAAETSYQTYSSIFGVRQATILVLMLQAGSIACLAFLSDFLVISNLAFLLLGLVWAGGSVVHLRFLRSLPKAAAPLRAVVEVYLLSWSLILVGAVLWSRGCGWAPTRLGAL